MKVENRAYQILQDFDKVSEFLTQNYEKELRNGYFLQPLFEYGQNHDLFKYHCSHRNRIWEADGEIVGIVFYEMMFLGKCFMVTRPKYQYLKEEMLTYAEEKIALTQKGKTSLGVWTTDANTEDISLLKGKGYALVDKENIMEYDYTNGFEHPELPKGFRIVEGEDIDPHKLAWCDWKGFDNGDLLEEGLTEEQRRYETEHLMSAPHYRKDLTTVIEAPDGEYACVAGMWLDGEHDYAYLEPLATIPKYRRMNLGTIALMEGMKKTAKEGKKYCDGGSHPFYKAIGFEKGGERQLWEKKW